MNLSAVHVAVDAQRERAKYQLQMGWARDENKALLRMCDWADDVLREHQRGTLGGAALAKYDECRCINAWPCIEVLRVATAFGVETGETDAGD